MTIAVTATAMETATVPCYGGDGGNVGDGGGERQYWRKQPPWCGESFKVECCAISVR